MNTITEITAFMIPKLLPKVFSDLGSKIKENNVHQCSVMNWLILECFQCRFYVSNRKKCQKNET